MVDLLKKQVKHTGALGVGTVTEQDDKYITVQFASKTSKFMYPTAFEKFLIPVDPIDADLVKDEIEAVKAAEAETKAVEAAKKAAEEQAKIKALKVQSAASGKKVSSSKAYTPVKRVAGQALTYLVFQGDTYNDESTGQFIWAPKLLRMEELCITGIA